MQDSQDYTSNEFGHQIVPMLTRKQLIFFTLHIAS
jgi:hypothetical protein